MSNSLKLSLLFTSTLGISIIAIQLIPLNQNAVYWRDCIKETKKYLLQKENLQDWDESGIEALSVGICNGAVYSK